MQITCRSCARFWGCSAWLVLEQRMASAQPLQDQILAHTVYYTTSKCPIKDDVTQLAACWVSVQQQPNSTRVGVHMHVTCCPALQKSGSGALTKVGRFTKKAIHRGGQVIRRCGGQIIHRNSSCQLSCCLLYYTRAARGRAAAVVSQSAW